MDSRTGSTGYSYILCSQSLLHFILIALCESKEFVIFTEYLVFNYLGLESQNIFKYVEINRLSVLEKIVLGINK